MSRRAPRDATGGLGMTWVGITDDDAGTRPALGMELQVPPGQNCAQAVP
jgi:hypothetical protein